MGRSPCCDKAIVKRGPWSPEEDATLRKYIDKHGHGGNWIALPQKAGLNRCGKSCRLRWLNYLRPNIKHGGFTEDEDNIICTLYSKIGSRWSVIASKLNGRTDNDVKNYWNTKLKRKLIARQQSTKDMITYKFTNESINLDHQPSPILHTIKSEDYNNININNTYTNINCMSNATPFSVMSLLEQPEFSSSINYSSEVSAASSSCTTTSSFSEWNSTEDDQLFFSQLGFGDPSDFLSYNYEYQDYKLGEVLMSNVWNSANDQNKPQEMYQSVTYS